MSEKTVSTSQSLFQTYYLGQTAVDRRCPTSVMPWIIEELKLHAETMRFVWLTPGEWGMWVVATCVYCISLGPRPKTNPSMDCFQ